LSPAAPSLLLLLLLLYLQMKAIGCALQGQKVPCLAEDAKK
jgi:hypothetical protein